MTMYYSTAEMRYVEMQRTKRIMEAAAKSEIDLVEDIDGVFRLKKDSENWTPDMSDLMRHGD